MNNSQEDCNGTGHVFLLSKSFRRKDGKDQLSIGKSLVCIKCKKFLEEINRLHLDCIPDDTCTCNICVDCGAALEPEKGWKHHA